MYVSHFTMETKYCVISYPTYLEGAHGVVVESPICNSSDRFASQRVGLSPVCDERT